MKTIFCYCEIGGWEFSKYFILDGDYSHLDNTIINHIEAPEDKQSELSGILFDQDSGDYVINFYDKPQKEWLTGDFQFINTGFFV